MQVYLNNRWKPVWHKVLSIYCPGPVIATTYDGGSPGNKVSFQSNKVIYVNKETDPGK